MHLQLQPALATAGCSKSKHCEQCAVQCSGSFFLTILNPFHSIWETPAVVSRALSSHHSYSNASAKKISLLSLSLLLSLPVYCLSVFPSPSHSASLPVSAGVLAASREQRAGGVRSKHRLLPQMLRGEW